MNRLKQYWKVVAYLVGFVVLSLSASETVVAIYGLPGLAWLVVYLVRQGDGGRVQSFDDNRLADPADRFSIGTYAETRHADGFSNPRPLDAAYADYPPFR